jgi:hypothetical protein
LVAAALLSAGAIFAKEKGEHACCAKNASNKEKAACADFASLGVSADQKSKLEAWQSECMKAGCTKESRAKFLEQAKAILSADQYAKLKAECDKTSQAKRSEA